jgi:hypothetical protein
MNETSFSVVVPAQAQAQIRLLATGRILRVKEERRK